MVVVDNHTDFVICILLAKKSQFDHAKRGIIKFIQMLGCDKGPAILQLKRFVLRTRQAMGLKTRESSAVAYDKGNSLAENAVGRVRPFVCSLMHQVHGRLGIHLPTSSAIWSWALQNAAWLISRFLFDTWGNTT